MSISNSVQSNRAKQFARFVDSADQSASRASKRRAGNVRVDNSAPTVIVSDLTGDEQTVRLPLHKAGSVSVSTGKSHGTIATPRSYTIWLKAGQPAHPIYNREAWKRERYLNGIALPTCGPKAIEPSTSVRHDTATCVCVACTEYRTFKAKALVNPAGTENTPNRDLSGKSNKTTREWFRAMLTDMKLSGVVKRMDAETIVPLVPVQDSGPIRPPVRGT